MDEYIDICQNVISKTIPKVDYIDIRAGTGSTTGLVMKDRNIDEITTGNTFGVRVRVLNNGAWGFAYTNDFSKLDEITDTSVRLSNSLKGEVELAEADVVTDKIKNDVKIQPSDVSIEEKKNLLKEVSDIADFGEIVSITASYSDNESNSIFLNSDGSLIEQNTTRTVLSLNSVAKDGEMLQNGHGSIGGVKGFEVFKEEDLEKYAREISEKAIRLLSAESVPSGQYPIIADNLLTGVLIHEALGHAVEGDLIIQNDSILKDKIGEIIASDIVNIFDDASMKDGYGYYAYDAEGVKTKPNQLVKDGKLVGLLNSRESGKKLGMKSSGNARSYIQDQPIVRMSNTYLQPGELTFDELIEDIKDGIYLKGSRGGQVDTGKGIFQFNAAEAYKINNGEITTTLRDVSLSGNILETLKNVAGVGKDFKMSVGNCGKGGQIVPVGDGGPHTKILNALVGGSQ